MTLGSAPSSPQTAPSGNWLRGLLVVSLAANLLIAGAFIGGAWVMHLHGGPPLSPRAQAAGLGVGPIGKFLSTLPPERVAELREPIAQYQMASVGFNKSLAGVRHEAADALVAVPFDGSRFQASLKHVYEIELAGRLAMMPAAGSLMDQLNNRERAAFLRMLRWQPSANTENKPADKLPDAKAP